MAYYVPAFALCVATCDPHDPDCTDDAALDWMVGERWNEKLRGSDLLARSILEQWGMATKAELAGGQKQVFLYVPPCIHAIEIALCVSMGRAEVVGEVFEEEQRVGLPWYLLPSKIRVDHRLGAGGCGGGSTAQTKMEKLRSYVKSCDADERQIPQMERTMLTSLHSGPWTAKHFDIPYLDQRCYELANGKDTGPMSVQVVKSAAPNHGWATGDLIASGPADIAKILGSSTTEADAVPTAPQPAQMFKLTHLDSENWTPSYYGDFPTSRPPISRIERLQKEKEEREEQREEMRREGERYKIDWKNLEQETEMKKIASLAMNEAGNFAKKFFKK